VVVFIALFIAAGLLEIGGGWLIWQNQREGKQWWFALLGALALVLYGFVPTWQPPEAGEFGRVYA
jgi:drug/metabolite transporter superfamily protein YnfA